MTDSVNIPERWWNDDRFKSDIEVYKALKVAEAALAQRRWVSVEDRLPELDADNCCMGEEDYGRYSSIVLVFDDNEGRALGAFYDGRLHVWLNSEVNSTLSGVTHWMPMPELPEEQSMTDSVNIPERLYVPIS